jgi:hypothetical protein
MASKGSPHSGGVLDAIVGKIGMWDAFLPILEVLLDQDITKFLRGFY